MPDVRQTRYGAARQSEKESWMKLLPLGARILVKRLPTPERTRGGLYMLGREYPTIGEVIAIGNGKKHPKTLRRSHLPEIFAIAPAMRLCIGDYIVFHREAIRQELTFEEDYVLLSQEHCLATYKKD